MTALLAAAAVGLVALLLGASQANVAGRAADLVAPVVALVTVAFVALGAPTPFPVPLAAMGLVSAWVAQREFRRQRERGRREARSRAVLETCETLASALRAGLAPIQALEAAASDWPELRTVFDAARLGGDVPGAFLQLARLPGGGGLRAVAAAWVVAHRSGAGLAAAVELAARSVREDQATARVVATELASARATAKLLAVLPLGVLLLGRGTGGDPFHFLLGTSPGLVCLGAGLGLMWCGLAWIERIAGGVQG